MQGEQTSRIKIQNTDGKMRSGGVCSSSDRDLHILHSVKSVLHMCTSIKNLLFAYRIYEFLVVCNDDDLEVGLLGASGDDLGQGGG